MELSVGLADFTQRIVLLLAQIYDAPLGWSCGAVTLAYGSAVGLDLSLRRRAAVTRLCFWTGPSSRPPTNGCLPALWVKPGSRCGSAPLSVSPESADQQGKREGNKVQSWNDECFTSYNLKQGINQPNWGRGAERPRNFPLLSFFIYTKLIQREGIWSEGLRKEREGIILFLLYLI